MPARRLASKGVVSYWTSVGGRTNEIFVKGKCLLAGCAWANTILPKLILTNFNKNNVQDFYKRASNVLDSVFFSTTLRTKCYKRLILRH